MMKQKCCDEAWLFDTSALVLIHGYISSSTKLKVSSFKCWRKKSLVEMWWPHFHEKKSTTPLLEAV